MSTRPSLFSIRVAPNPFVPRKRDPACSEPSVLKCLGTNSAACVPAQAGTHTHKLPIIAGPATSLCCGVWVPGFAGTTIESHCFTSANVDRQPNRRLARVCPFDTMARVRRDVQIVTGLELAHLRLAVEAQAGAAGQQYDPFGFILVVPEAGRACLPGGDDPLDAHVGCREQRGDVLIGAGA